MPVRAYAAGGTSGLQTQDHGTEPAEGSDELAFALPRLHAPDQGPVALPLPLAPSVAATYRAIFAAQRGGDFAVASARMGALKDRVLLGDVLADRYVSASYKPQASELRAWLKSYPTLADAPAVQARLVAISPHGTVSTQGFPASLSASTVDDQARMALDPLAHLVTRNPLLDHTVSERAGWGVKGARSALHLIASTSGMTPLYSAQLRAEIALTMLSAGENGFAYRTARDAFLDSDRKLAFAGYVAGLSAWRQGLTDQALWLFETSSRATLTSAELRAGAAYWAARSRLRLHDRAGAAAWLQRAGADSSTFYGILATRALEAHGEAQGRHGPMLMASDELKLQEPMPVLSEIDVEAIAASPQGMRLFALLQVGETARAEALLRRMWPDVKSDGALCRSMQLVAQAAGMRDLSEQIATILAARDGRPAHVSGFPVPRLSPRHGFRMDPALVYAMTRLESNFDAGAASGAGAHGLMQIMPVTASFVTSKQGAGHAVAVVDDGIVDRLHIPAVNLEIGQLYMLYLADVSRHHDDDDVAPSGGDMVRMLASYNAGPSAISHWEGLQKDTADPLLFMETLPSSETRDYVHRAFTYLWIYADKLGLPAPSLTSLARAEWPSFGAETALAGRRVTVH